MESKQQRAGKRREHRVHCFMNPVVAELVLVDVKFNNWVAHLTDEEALEVRRMILGRDVEEV